MWEKLMGRKKFLGGFVKGFVAFKCPNCGKHVSLPTEELLVWCHGDMCTLHIYCNHCEEVYQITCNRWDY